MKYVILLISCLIFSCASKEGIYSYPKPQRVVIAEKGFLICVEPPIPAIMTHNTKSKIGVDVPNVEVGASVDYNESLHKMYELNNENLLMQYAMYRLCEMMLNLHILSEEKQESLVTIYQERFGLIFKSVQKLLEAKANSANSKVLQAKYKMFRLQADVLTRQISKLEKQIRSGTNDPETQNKLKQKYSELQRLLDAIRESTK